MAIPQQSIRFYDFGPFRMNSVERIMLREGEIVPLTPKQFDLLLLLVENRGHVVEKQRLMDEIWPDTEVEEGNLTVNISALRKALDEGANGPRYIQTLPRRGYRFVGQVVEVTDDGTGLIVQEQTQSRVVIEQEEETEADARQKTLAGSRWVNRSASWKLGLTAGGLLIATAAILLFWIWDKPKPTASDRAVKRIAVLPFKPLVADNRDEALELGMADTLINKLSGIRQLIVRPISEVRKYNALDQDPIAAGRELDVDYVFEAHLQIVDEKIKATMWLLNVKDGSTIWADTCDKQCSNVFELQDSIAGQVASSLALLLTDEEKKQLTRHNTENAEAFQLYSLGIFYGLQGRRGDNWEEARRCFENAIKLDPNYALAYTGLFNCYLGRGMFGFWLPEESRQRAEWAAMKAVELDDSLAEAHSRLGIAKETLHWDWAGADKELKRALELDPNSYAVNFDYYGFLVHAGRPDEALAHARRAQELIGRGHGSEAYVYLHKREYDKAIELLLNTQNPRVGNQLAEAYLGKGMYGEAIAHMQKVVAWDNAPERWDRYPILAYAYAVAGRRDEALKILDAQKQLAKRGYISPFNFAIIYTGLGDKDRAFEFLNKAIEERAPMLHHFPSRPIFDSLRSDPRFTELLRKMNLAS
ncbi:MAG TPA: winged helix-turn-helix domain-containing protein [Blastocatellia bacterium]|nr:winged helix-turn-helix domain-containing protein [Blastocatellia bacterium]